MLVRRLGSCHCLLLRLGVRLASYWSTLACLRLVLLLLLLLHHVVAEILSLRHADGSTTALRMSCGSGLSERHGLGLCFHALGLGGVSSY